MTRLADVGAAQVGIGVVRVYQWTLRPIIGSHCRFWPSCSEYAVEALRQHGAARGSVMAARRILRCNPWHEGGVDPVPEGHLPERAKFGIDRNMGH
jgi:putative membrane protein insertion efficiency factor